MVKKNFSENNYCYYSHYQSNILLKTGDPVLDSKTVEYLENKKSISSVADDYKRSDLPCGLINLGVLYNDGYKGNMGRYCREALEKGDERAKYFLGSTALARGESNKKKKYIEIGKKYLDECKGANSYAYTRLGDYYKKKGKNDKANEMYILAINMDNNPYAMIQLSEFLVTNGEIGEALQYLCKVYKARFSGSLKRIVDFCRVYDFNKEYRKYILKYFKVTNSQQLLKDLVFDVENKKTIGKLIKQKLIDINMIEITLELLDSFISSKKKINKSLKEKINVMVARSKNIEYYEKYKKYLNSDNLEKLAKIEIYTVIDNTDRGAECIICLEEENCYELLCHSAHIICRKCIMQMDSCPVCDISM